MNAIHTARRGPSRRKARAPEPVAPPPSPAPPVEALANIDLNLIVAFDALARERNVTRAAARVGVTQSAMSHALRRLRELLGDALLVRGRSGMVLTPRADALTVPVRSGLLTLARALAQPDPFDPRTVQRAFSLATPDLFDAWVGPTLLERVGLEAPGVDLTVQPVDRRRLPEQLETGEVDAALVAQLDDAPPSPELSAPGLVRRTLLRDHWVCLIRADHPALQASARKRTRQPAAHGSKRVASESLSLETFAALSHMLVSPTGEGRGLVDSALERHGLRRRIALRVPAFYAALPIVAKSDLVLTAPAAIASLLPADGSVVGLPVPVALPGHSLNLVWHERFSADPGHGWLRSALGESCRLTEQRAREPSR